MKDFTREYPGRRFDELFYANTQSLTVDKVQAFVCPPNDESTRWVPEHGFSTSVGHSLQWTPEGAKRYLVLALVKERHLLKTRLDRINTFLKGKDTDGHSDD